MNPLLFFVTRIVNSKQICFNFGSTCIRLYPKYIYPINTDIILEINLIIYPITNTRNKNIFFLKIISKYSFLEHSVTLNQK